MLLKLDLSLDLDIQTLQLGEAISGSSVVHTSQQVTASSLPIHTCDWPVTEFLRVTSGTNIISGFPVREEQTCETIVKVFMSKLDIKTQNLVNRPEETLEQWELFQRVLVSSSFLQKRNREISMRFHFSVFIVLSPEKKTPVFCSLL